MSKKITAAPAPAPAVAAVVKKTAEQISADRRAYFEGALAPVFARLEEACAVYKRSRQELIAAADVAIQIALYQALVHGQCAPIQRLIATVDAAGAKALIALGVEIPAIELDMLIDKYDKLG